MTAYPHSGQLALVEDRVAGRLGSVAFTVLGVAQPGGSKKGFRHPTTARIVIVEDAKRSRPWRALVADAAIEAMAGRDLLSGPLKLRVTFVLPRPKGHYGTRGLRPSAPAWPAVRPDATKLLRSLEDACTGLVWRDDAQVVRQVVEKVYGSPARAEVVVTQLVARQAA